MSEGATDPGAPAKNIVRDDPITIVVAEDNVLVREGVVALLGTRRELEVIAVAEDLDSLLKAVEQHQPDVVLTDIRMPPNHSDEGIRAAGLIDDRSPGTGIVVLSQYEDPSYAVRLLNDGSDGRGYLLKERVTNADFLVDAIVEVASGGSHIDPKVVEKLVNARAAQSSALSNLTAREIEVLSEIAGGKDNSAIARSLFISVRSVEKHINSVFAKLGLTEIEGVNRRVAAVLLYLQD